MEKQDPLECIHPIWNGIGQDMQNPNFLVCSQ